MEDYNAGVAPLGRLGGVQWRRTGFKVMAGVFGLFALGLFISAALTRSFTLVPMAAVTAIGSVMMLALVGQFTEHTVVYSSELVLHNRQGPYATLSRGSVASFRIVEYGESAPRIFAVGFNGQETKIAGSDQPQGGWLRDAVRPRRNANEMKAKLDHWLHAGSYPT